MKRSIAITSLLFTGAVLGWWLRDLVPQNNQTQPQAPVSSSNTRVAITPRLGLPDTQEHTDIDASPTLEHTRSPQVGHFETLLDQQEFEQAIAYYESALEVNGSYHALLKPSLERYLEASLHQCEDGVFVDLVDQWLDTYYEDISVLLLLAENQRFCNSPEEAARTLQIASTYAVQPGLQASVKAAVTSLITATDESLSEQQSWIELLGFYEFLHAIDLSTNASQLRRAALYRLMGESQRSQELLSALRKNDDRLDPEWTAALDLHWTKSAQQSPADGPPAQTIPLTRKGDHFIVAAYINDVSEVSLMIDTGASITTLSSNSFTQINDTRLGYRGSRLFNTPNGMTQGEIYQTGSMTLGNTRISAAEIAVLDYESPAGVDGLLGMNILRNYRFQIDQDKGVLYLRPRR